jgi:hypothetical protein
MAFGAQTLFNAIESHARASGLFDSVNTFEPKSAPGGNLHCAIYVSGLQPAPLDSGLFSTAGVLTIMARIYLPMIQEPQDKIDPTIVAATDTLMEDFSGDFTLGGNARNIDLLGQSGAALSALAGYITIDQTVFRSMDITIPIVVNDVFTQAP